MILIICLITLNLSATDFSKYKNGTLVNLKVSYLNMNHFKLSDRFLRNRLFLKTFITNNPITIFSSFKEKNVFDYLGTPTNTIYSSNLFNNEGNRAVLFENNNINEFVNIEKIEFMDISGLFKKNNISGYLINKKYIIYVIDFSNIKNKALLEKEIKKLNEVVNWSRRYFYIERKDIAFVGFFGLKYSELKNLLNGFYPTIKYPNRIVNFKNSLRMQAVENIILSENSSFKSKPNLFIRNDILNGEYKKDLKGYVKHVSAYYPLDLYIMNFKLNN